MNTRFYTVVLLTLLMASTSLAGNNLSIRLVEAGNRKKASSSGVPDVISILKKSFSYNSYNLTASGRMTLPAKKSTQKLGEYVVTCSGKQKNLSIRVMHNNKTIINTTVSLHDNKPVMVGGFPAKNGEFILVFIAK